MSEFDIYEKIRKLIDSMEELDMQNDVNRAMLQYELARRFRLSNSEIGQILADMMEKDRLKKINRYKLKIR
jgi:hypothetical protein